MLGEKIFFFCSVVKGIKMVRTMQIKIEDSPANALDLCRDMSHVVVAGRNMMKIYSIEVSA